MCLFVALFQAPSPPNSFLSLAVKQKQKTGRACYLFSHEHDEVREFSEQTACIVRIIQPTTRSMLSVYDSHPPLAKYMHKVPATLAVCCGSVPCVLPHN